MITESFDFSAFGENTTLNISATSVIGSYSSSPTTNASSEKILAIAGSMSQQNKTDACISANAIPPTVFRPTSAAACAFLTNFIKCIPSNCCPRYDDQINQQRSNYAGYLLGCSAQCTVAKPSAAPPRPTRLPGALPLLAPLLALLPALTPTAA